MTSICFLKKEFGMRTFALMFVLVLTLQGSAAEIFKSREAINASQDYAKALSDSREAYVAALEKARKTALTKQDLAEANLIDQALKELELEDKKKIDTQKTAQLVKGKAWGAANEPFLREFLPNWLFKVSMKANGRMFQVGSWETLPDGSVLAIIKFDAQMKPLPQAKINKQWIYPSEDGKSIEIVGLQGNNNFWRSKWEISED